MSILSTALPVIVPAVVRPEYMPPGIGRLTLLPNGNVVASIGYTGFSTAAASIMLLGPDGAALSPQEFIWDNQRVYTNIQVLPLADGSFGVVFQMPFEPNPSQAGQSSHGKLMVEWFSSSGQSLGDPVRLAGTPDPVSFNSTPGGPLIFGGGAYSEFEIARAGSHSYVLWRLGDVPGGPSSPGADPGGIYIGEVLTNGGGIGTSLRVNEQPWPTQTSVQTVFLTPGDMSLTGLSDGRALVTWLQTAGTVEFIQSGPTQIPRTTATHTLQARYIDVSGTPTGPQLTLETYGTVTYDYTPYPLPAPPRPSSVDVIALTGGGFAVVWTEIDNASTVAEVKVRTYSAAGTALGAADVLVPAHTPYTTPYVDAVALADGSFAVIYSQAMLTFSGGPSLETAPHAQIYQANGQRAGGLLEFPGADQNGDLFALFGMDADQARLGFADFTLLANGQLFSGGAWLSGIPRVDGLTTQLYNFNAASVNPTEANDVALLDANHNTYGGMGGDDYISGLGGNDILFGDLGNDYLDGGAGVDAAFGGGGDDTIVYDGIDDLANVKGGDGTDTLHVINGGVPTAFDLSSHQFERATRSLIDTSGAPWSSISEEYNWLWQLLFSRQYNDDGSRRDTTYDRAMTQVWASSEEEFNAAAQRYELRTYYDDLTRRTTGYDVANAQTYATYEEDYNVAGVRTALRTYYDDGTRRTTGYDTQGLSWSTYEEDYNAAGQRTAIRTYNDDGTRRVTQYDPANTANWSLIEEYFNATGPSGTRYRQITDYDDGVTTRARLDTSWDVDDAAAWLEQTTQYDNTGAVVRIYGIMDDLTPFG